MLAVHPMKVMVSSMAFVNVMASANYLEIVVNLLQILLRHLDLYVALYILTTESSHTSMNCFGWSRVAPAVGPLMTPPTQVLVRDNCVSLNNSLPPITDINTGMVYANEFCAICNRAQGFAVW